MLLLGSIALVLMPAATLAAILAVGWLVLVRDSERFYSFRIRKWGGWLLHLIGKILGELPGLLIVRHLVAGTLAWTQPSFPSAVPSAGHEYPALNLRFSPAEPSRDCWRVAVPSLKGRRSRYNPLPRVFDALAALRPTSHLQIQLEVRHVPRVFGLRIVRGII